jgi:hypothetical protein
MQASLFDEERSCQTVDRDPDFVWADEYWARAEHENPTQSISLDLTHHRLYDSRR